MKDVLKRKQLEKKFPNMFMEVLYDSIATNPFVEGNKMHKFAFSKPMSKKVTTWVKENTQKQNASETTFNTQRTNSSATALAWKGKLDSREIKEIQEACKELMLHLHLNLMD